MRERKRKRGREKGRDTEKKGARGREKGNLHGGRQLTGSDFYFGFKI